MNLKDYFSQGLGRQSDLARALGTYSSNINDWINGLRPVPVKYGAQIESWTRGAVTREEIFPDSWQAVWPELVLRKRAAK